MQGIPSFWLTIFKNVEMLAEMVQVNSQLKFDPFGRKKLWFLFNFLGFFPLIISFDYVFQEADEPVLECLTDVTVTFAESSPMGFTLHFHFRWVLYCTVLLCTLCDKADSRFYRLRNTIGVGIL